MSKKEKEVLMIEAPKEEEIEILEPKEEVSVIEPTKVYIIQIGLYDSDTFADMVVADLKHKGFKAVKDVKEEGIQVHCGIYSIKSNAEDMYFRLQSLGYKPEIV